MKTSIPPTTVSFHTLPLHNTRYYIFMVHHEHNMINTGFKLILFQTNLIYGCLESPAALHFYSISQVQMPDTHEPVQVRVGLHTGDVVTGLIGSKLPKFSIFGR